MRLEFLPVLSALAFFVVVIVPIDLHAQSSGLSANTDSVGATTNGLSSTAQGTAVRTNEVRATDARPVGIDARQKQSGTGSSSTEVPDSLLGSSRCGDPNYRRDRKRGQNSGSRLLCDQ